MTRSLIGLDVRGMKLYFSSSRPPPSHCPGPPAALAVRPRNEDELKVVSESFRFPPNARRSGPRLESSSDGAASAVGCLESSVSPAFDRIRSQTLMTLLSAAVDIRTPALVESIGYAGTP